MKWNDFIDSQDVYLHDLLDFLHEREKEVEIYPDNPWRAFDITPFNKVKVVILGQDPYHTPDVANGLAFSVDQGCKIPPSLKNVFKELKSDVGCSIPNSGDLTKWAEQGVLLLNTILTVEKGKPLAHEGLGWEQFTDNVIKVLAERGNVVFMLWGAKAKDKAALIEENSSKGVLILKAAHPSPYSADNGFFGCRHFSRENEWLDVLGEKRINWKI